MVVQTWRTIFQDLNLFILQFFLHFSRKCWVGTSGLADLRALRTAPFGIGVAIKWQTHNLLGLLGPFCFHVLEWTECKDRPNDVEDVESVYGKSCHTNMLSVVLNELSERYDFYSVGKYLHFNPNSKGKEMFGSSIYPEELSEKTQLELGYS